MSAPQIRRVLDQFREVEAEEQSDEEARLAERVRELEAAVTRTVDGSPDRHCANMRLCDAYAALDKHRKNSQHPQGYFV